LGPDRPAGVGFTHFKKGFMDNVFGMAAASGDSRRESNQALTTLKEYFKQLGPAPRRIGLLHDAPELFYESVSEGREFILIKNYLQ
jgi:hypothetical protein